MKIDLDFLGSFKKSKLFKIFNQIPNTDNIYEYAIAIYRRGEVYGTIYLEHEIIDSFDNIIGNFGVNFEHKVFIYNLKKESKNDTILGREKRHERIY
jgi:hypothetical protein